MSFWDSKKIKKTRKPHRCEYCGAEIPVGSSCDNEVGTFEGDFNNYYLCNRCLVFMDLYRDASNGDELGGIDDEIFDCGILDCPKCGSYRHMNTEWADDMQSIDLTCSDCGEDYTVDISLEALEKIWEEK